MSDDRDDKWFLRASRERAEKAETERTLEDITSAMGERRPRDLLDIVASVEQNKGWNTALEYLVAAADKKYSTPASFGKQQTEVEPLKYREMVFSLLSCSGLEPVQTDTTTLLRMLESKTSLADASQSLILYTQETAMKQIESGDTLYFSFPPDEKFDELSKLLESTRTEKMANLTLKLDGEHVDLTHLWYSEYGRLALSDLGIKGTKASIEQLDMVLSVIQVSPTIKRGIQVFDDESTSLQESPTPSNSLYANLLQSMIKQDLDGLSTLASRHSVPTLIAMLENSVGQYQESLSSENYRYMLECMNTHVAVRTLDSIMAFQKLVKLDDPRIVTPSINALGNFYNESSVLTLAETLCRRKDEWVVRSVLDALDNVFTKCPEAEPAIRRTLESDCVNSTPLKHFLLRVSK